MAAPNEYFKLFTGQLYPALGYGTWQAKDKQLEEAFEKALEVGYRHIDTAYLYENETIIGEVLNKWFTSGKIKREDIFLVTKLPPRGMRPEGVKKYIQRSLTALQVDYVDLYLVHLPIGFHDEDENQQDSSEEKKMVVDNTTDHIAIWKAMEEMVDAGKTKAIGLSNFNVSQIERVLKNARIQPANLQVELHVYLQQNELVDFCKKHNIVVTAYSPLGNPNLSGRFGTNTVDLLKDPVVNKIAAKLNKSPAQILLKHIVQRGIATIPKSTNVNRLKENINIFDFTLTDDEMQQLNALDRRMRILKMDVFKGMKEHPEYPFSDEK